MTLIRFGIPSLDALLGGPQDSPSAWGIELTESSEAVSVCIIGPEGTGKSILGLHLASHYLADARAAGAGCDSKVLYISTDLTFTRANRVWTSFDLARPGKRNLPFYKDVLKNRPSARLKFKRRLPTRGGEDVIDHLLAPSSKEVAFLDLAAFTAGDDWGYVKRLVASLQKPKGMRHMIVIDALEGFETLSGDCDAFGEALSRRSRIAQMMRLAADKAHLVFIVEEAAAGVRVPEEFVTDVVLRLRAEMLEGYSRRTIEIEKVRGQTHARGRHYITIRKGGGSTTGRGDCDQSDFVNPDDPEVKRAPGGDLLPDVSQAEFQSYVHVFHSLHHQSRWIMEHKDSREAKQIRECAPFGVPRLDDMLAEAADPQILEPYAHGLPVGAVTALIGHPDTQKRRLGHAFLAQTFGPLIAAIDVEFSRRPGGADAKWYSATAARVVAKDAESGAAVLITTEDMNARSLARLCAAWKSKTSSEEGRRAIEDALVKMIVCRRLENHDLPTPILFHIVRAAIDAAAEKAKRKTRIRVVIEDYSTWTQIYPEVRRESLFLPFLLFYLRRKPVTTLIIDTHSGRPDAPLSDPSDSELRTLVDHQIYTWRVPFYGESRIAIAAIPPLSKNRVSVVRELRWSPPRPGEDPPPPEIDPHFELYTGLEEGKPAPAPLQIVMFNEAPQFGKYIERENVFFNTRFTPVPADPVPGEPARGDPGRADPVRGDKAIAEPPPGEAAPGDTRKRPSVIVGLGSAQHGILKSFGAGHDTRLDHTLVFQADEFWYNSSRCPGAPAPGLLPRKEYLDEITSRRGETDATADPGGIFRQSRLDSPNKDMRRISRFDHRLDSALLDTDGVHAAPESDRIPFMWDFGFLLCRPAQWASAHSLKIPAFRRDGTTVGAVWNALPKAYGQNDEMAAGRGGGSSPEAASPRPSWRDFLGACKVVSVAAHQPPIPPFDLALTTSESLACLILEVWGSEVYDRLTADGPRQTRFVERLTTRSRGRSGYGLDHGIHVFDFELYKAWLLLLDVLDFSRLASPSDPFSYLSREAQPNAVAVRHWYKSACAASAGPESEGLLLPVGLPGHFSTRGDWFLAAAGSSRSSRLADRAMDLLSSATGNFTRMQMGLGLPTLLLTSEEKRIRTALSPPTDDSGIRRGQLSYAALKTLGKSDAAKFYWLWRSSLADYDAGAGIWKKWIARVVVAWDQFRIAQGNRWAGGMAIYDRLAHYQVGALDAHPAAWKDEDPLTYQQFMQSAGSFASLCEFLRTLLLEALPYQGSDQPPGKTRTAAAGRR